ncbi:MAG: YdcF family protein [Parcubacteria group bacterium]|nr:YdcF family protein [Parcubacteria group bacterium]
MKKILAAATTVVALAIAFTLFPISPNRWLVRPLLAEQALQPVADLAIVLGGGLRLDGSLSDLSAERVREAMRIYQTTGIALLFTGGKTARGVEAEAMRVYAQDLGYAGPEYIEGQSGSTYENALYSDQLLDEAAVGTDDVLIITSPYHSRRSLAVFQKLMPERRISITYPAMSVVYARQPLARWCGLYAVAREYAANVWYAMRYRVW